MHRFARDGGVETITSEIPSEVTAVYEFECLVQKFTLETRRHSLRDIHTGHPELWKTSEYVAKLESRTATKV